MTPGQSAYEGYCAASGYRSLNTNKPLPRWDLIGEPCQKAWEIAGKTVLLHHAPSAPAPKSKPK